MYHEAHGNDFDESLQSEYNREQKAQTLQLLIKWGFIISIVVVVTRQSHRVDKNHKDDKVIKPWMAEYIHNLLSKKELSLTTHARSFVINSKLPFAIHFETESVAVFLLSRQSKDVFLSLLLFSVQFGLFNYRNKNIIVRLCSETVNQYWSRLLEP